MAARHKNMSTASLYIQNSTMLFWSVQEQGDALSEHKVGVWKMNYIGPSVGSIYSISAASHAQQFPLFGQAEWFVQKELDLPLTLEKPEVHYSLSFGDIDNKLTGLQSVRGIQDGEEATLINLLKNTEGLSEAVILQVIDLVCGIKEDGIAAGREGQKRKAEEDASKSARQLCTTPTKTTRPSRKQQSAVPTVVTPGIAGIEEIHNNHEWPIVTPDLKEWKIEWNWLKAPKKNASCCDLFLFLEALEELGTMKTCVFDSSGRNWKQRTPKVLEGFHGCIANCSGGCLQAFYNSQHTGKFGQVSSCTCVKDGSKST
ncbi:hypothetical protein ACA910_014413 [Epithemia clementina (nom. ined.)]